MSALDWAVLTTYFAAIVVLSISIGRRQKDGTDYFLGGRSLGRGLVALSLAANQVSAISLVGAPAFVAMSAGGGLVWLQYEFAVPLAMIAVMFLLAPLFRRQAGATVFEYAERRFGLTARLVLSALFLVSRGLAAGVVLYASALVLAVALGIPVIATLAILGSIAVAYTTIGGITADVASDAIQLVILWLGTAAAVIVALQLVGGIEGALASVQPERLATIDLAHHGLGDGRDYALWPMLIGGFFLYLSYYGCDQSQAQRLISTTTLRAAGDSLAINGLVRFPIVLTYCALGVLLAAFLAQNPSWIVDKGITNPNYLVPTFIVSFLPAGVVGLVMAGIFAATMSSIDSALNSLAAVTMTDFVARFRPSAGENRKRFLHWSRLTTLFWGLFCVAGGYFIARSPRTVIELVNMIGSAFYGPILAVFMAGALLRRVNGTGALFGLAAGLATNVSLWLFAPGVSWLWWNPIGFGVALATARIASFIQPVPSAEQLEWTLRSLKANREEHPVWWLDYRTWILVVAFFAILIISVVIGLTASR